jgi:hypothetical protein
MVRKPDSRRSSGLGEGRTLTPRRTRSSRGRASACFRHETRAGTNGIEPSTSALTKQCSTSELRPHQRYQWTPGDRTRTPSRETAFETAAYASFRQRSTKRSSTGGTRTLTLARSTRVWVWRVYIPPRCCVGGRPHGSDGRTRTSAYRVMSPVLCRLSYAAACCWRAGQGSNLRPAPSAGAALSLLSYRSEVGPTGIEPASPPWKGGVLPLYDDPKLCLLCAGRETPGEAGHEGVEPSTSWERARRPEPLDQCPKSRGFRPQRKDRGSNPKPGLPGDGFRDRSTRQPCQSFPRADPGGFEPPTYGLGNRCSVPLSYGSTDERIRKDSNPQPAG